ncbi:MAG: hypothetical protein J5529_07170 [Prevotella sp.]|nr:hypothetical protein [Prevotella sp.]
MTDSIIIEGFVTICGIVLLIVLAIRYFAQLLEEAHIERCERWKKEQMEAGMSEEMADHILLSDPDFIL